MAIPQKREDLIAAGWLFDNEAKCRGCNEPIEWWITPAGKKMPMTVQEVKAADSPISPTKAFIRVPHWGVCPNAADFRRGEQ